MATFAIHYLFYKRMISLPSPAKVMQKGKNHALFEVDGLYPGYGVTVGNSLRRVLLSSLL